MTESQKDFAKWQIIGNKFISSVYVPDISEDCGGFYETMVFHIKHPETFSVTFGDGKAAVSMEDVDFGIDYGEYFKRADTKEEIIDWHMRVLKSIREENRHNDNHD